MSMRTAKFISALVATMLASASFTAGAQNATESADNTKTADTCLSAPKGDAPAGSHWYYRLDRSNKRKCWYVREENSKAAKAASAQQQSPPPAETAPAPQPAASMSPSVADARAELRSPQVGARQNPASPLDNALPNGGAPGSGSLVSERWLDQSSMASSGGSKLAATDTATSPPEEEAQAAPQPTPPPAPAIAHSTAERQSTSTQTLLFIMAGTLALAGLIGGVIFRLNRASAPPYEVDNEWRAPWDRDHAERTPQLAAEHNESPPRPVEPSRPRRPEAAQPEPSFEDTQRQIKEMLARLAKSATA
ncbi:hypothetical protein I6F35_03590 [Bradyrhizobium sp. BRP22]|uniref:hypothetical protein n=1 Tax=Bradyrhizobium sp. BRP22 TaxID=2793821 RepID=UPI001CD2E175|nr:hypothetical protein [Bradyrhizobium sp. BRP22]MCA1452300.1 hypothetical protein [Bradyrhizobium sp. BRP22]